MVLFCFCLATQVKRLQVTVIGRALNSPNTRFCIYEKAKQLLPMSDMLVICKSLICKISLWECFGGECKRSPGTGMGAPGRAEKRRREGKWRLLLDAQAQQDAPASPARTALRGLGFSALFSVALTID